MNESASADLAAAIANQKEAIAKLTSEDNEWWTVQSAMTMSAVTLLFGFATLLLATYLLARVGADSKAILKVYGLILILTIAAFLMVAGYGSDQITPIIGLLGTLAGYLLGQEGGQDHGYLRSRKLKPEQES